MHHYNPDWLDDEALVADFIARQDEFHFLRDELARAPRCGSVQHHLLVGPRGVGKTTLLKRLAVAIRHDDDLTHLVALSFPEELYQVKNLGDFWWATCEALADELDRTGQGAASAQLYAAVDRVRAPGAAGQETPPEAGLSRLLAACAALNRRPVLFIDNLDLVLERIDKRGRTLKDPLSPTYWALREALSTTTSPIVIGSSVRLSEPFLHYDKAFYDFFLPMRLGKLPLAEVRSVLEHLADRHGAPEVKSRLTERAARVGTLYELTGGNPRAIGLIFELLRQGPNGRAVADFERLMDLTTPYYKARFEDLSEQAQVVMHALAVRRPSEDGGLRFGHTAAELGAHAGLPTKTVSAQLDVLEREGVVEKSAGRGRTQYRIAEQLFRLWLQMRGTRRVRQNVIGLTEFLEAMYDVDELTAQLPGSGGLDGARLAFAVAGARGAATLRRGLEAHGASLVLDHVCASGEAFDDRLAPGDLPPEVNALVRLRLRLRQCRTHGLSAAEQDALLGSLELGLRQKEASVTALCAPQAGPAEAARLRPLLAGERGRLLRIGLHEEDLPLLYALRAEGQLPLPWLSPDDAEAVCRVHPDPRIKPLIWRLVGAREWVKFTEASAVQWLEWGRRQAGDATSEEWANVAGALRRSKQLDAAEQALQEAFRRGESGRAWYERGAFLETTYGDAVAAETAYRKAMEIDPFDAWPWNGLGTLFANRLHRYTDAEDAYQQAIIIDPTFAWPWCNLGNLFTYRLRRYDKAEKAYQKAIETNPTYATPWNNLGKLFAEKLQRYDEAEAAYRKAIEIVPTDARPWNNLGVLFADNFKRYDEAESAYRKALEIDPTYAMPWNNLGNLYTKMLKPSDYAENAYRKAIEITSSFGIPWGNLGLLLEQQERFDEALEAFDKASAQDTEYAAYWRNRRTDLAIRRSIAPLRQAPATENMTAMREAFAALIAGSDDDIAATLASKPIVEELLGQALADSRQATTLLGVMQELGFDKYARPLLLAYAAAVENRRDALDELEPEIRSASHRMYERLIAGRDAQTADTPVP